MKTKLIIGLLLIAGASIAQDTLNISNTNLAFNQQATFSNNDTLDVFYDVTRTSEPQFVKVVNKVNVYNAQGNFLDVGPQVLESNDSVSAEKNVPAPMQARVRTTSNVFKNGNNTVVIWPDNNDIDGYNPDSVKFEIDYDGLNSTFTIISHNDIQIIGQSLLINNNSNSKQEVYISNIKGQLVQQFNITANGFQQTQLPTGLYILSTIKENKKQSIKVLVK